MKIHKRGDRWVRPLNVPKGHWKKQLPTRTLSIGSRGNIEQLRELLQIDSTLINKRGPHGRTLLFEAIRKNRTQLVAWLLEQGADTSLTGCYNSESLVQLDSVSTALYYKRGELLKLLKENGATSDVFRSAFCGDSDAVEKSLKSNPNLILAEDPYDEIYFTPLVSFCVAGGQLNLLQHLVSKGAELQCYSAQLLFLATRTENVEILKFLLDCGLSARYSESSLWMATDRMDLLRLLVVAGLSPNQKPYRELTPLMYACRADKSQNLEKVEYLISLGAEINKKGPQGRTALHYAARSANRKMCEMLIQAGAEQHVRDDKNDTPLDVLVQRTRGK